MKTKHRRKKIIIKILCSSLGRKQWTNKSDWRHCCVRFIIRNRKLSNFCLGAWESVTSDGIANSYRQLNFAVFNWNIYFVQSSQSLSIISVHERMYEMPGENWRFTDNTKVKKKRKTRQRISCIVRHCVNISIYLFSFDSVSAVRLRKRRTCFRIDRLVSFNW